MQVLTSLFSAIIMVLVLPAADVHAEQPFPVFPERFPGSGDFPEPVEPGDLPPAYPEWPERPARRDIVPPPPPGPYMSSALSEVEAFPADPGGLRHEFRERSMPLPFFDVDMPWPEVPERGRPEVWMPESGEYRFVPDEIVRQLEAPSRSRYAPPVYRPYPGYRPAAPVRQPDYGYR